MRLMVTLREQEHNALWKLAEWERRDPRDQAALIIRHDLEARGLLPMPIEASASGPDEGPAQPAREVQDGM